MNICVTAQGDNLESLVDPRFGRCQYFIIVDPNTLKFEAIQNPSLSAGGGAGIQSGQLMVNKEVEVVLTGNVGPNAFATLEAAGIKMVTQVQGKILEVIEKYKEGQLSSSIDKPNVGSHFGVGMGSSSSASKEISLEEQASSATKDEEIKVLKEQARAMQESLKQITQKIEELDKDRKTDMNA
ncbi:MAG: NifB/NifX family molybdenum-iron cluster-binding protein [Candidatus Saelkia tenebricola]|nr:NifB/NifX family molybdenum-iron cluster-binding protein [Candidatus Saelkia tenebricola]